MANTVSSQNTKIIGSAVITALVLIGIYVLILNNEPPEKISASSNKSTTTSQTNANISTSTTQSTTTNGTTATTETRASSSVYKNGTYSATVNYQVPKHTNTIKVTISVDGDIVSSVSMESDYDDRESAEYINNFESGISGAIVGKKIDNANVSRLNGASDTSEGFNEALDQIIDQAKNS